MLATLVALSWSNSPWNETYERTWEWHPLPFLPGALNLPLREWLNEGLMTLFFFVVGLEVKREMVEGQLRSPRRAMLPLVAAAGGMLVPALLYLFFNFGEAGEGGWGVPVATDIAFAVGVLALIGRRAPAGLRIFLLTLAIADDIGAILVIALFYAREIAPLWLLVAAALVLLVLVLRKTRLRSPLWFVPVGVALWYAMLSSGVHATLTGVVLGLLTPAGRVAGRQVLTSLEHRLHPWSSYAVIPLFALGNAGVTLESELLGGALQSPVALGVLVGLLVGKPLGITLFSGFALATRLARLPDGVRFRHIVAAGALGGIGFTVSLFIAALAFPEVELLAAAKIGIFGGSLASGILGAVLLLIPSRGGLPTRES